MIVATEDAVVHFAAILSCFALSIS